MKTIAAIVPSLLLVVACSTAPAPPPSTPAPGEAPPPSPPAAEVPRDGPAEGSLPAQVILGIGETVSLDDGRLVVRFADLVSDLRCPAAAHCVRAGEAEVDVELRAGGETATLRLGTPSPTTRVADGALGYAVQLLDVTPVPRSTRPLDEAEYRLRLHVDRLAEP